jgi:hypothetical protein
MIAALYNESLQVFCGLLFTSVALLIWSAVCFLELSKVRIYGAARLRLCLSISVRILTKKMQNRMTDIQKVSLFIKLPLHFVRPIGRRHSALFDISRVAGLE